MNVTNVLEDMFFHFIAKQAQCMGGFGQGNEVWGQSVFPAFSGMKV
jgi:hypothetical protein